MSMCRPILATVPPANNKAFGSRGHSDTAGPFRCSGPSRVPSSSAAAWELRDFIFDSWTTMCNSCTLVAGGAGAGGGSATGDLHATAEKSSAGMRARSNINRIAIPHCDTGSEKSRRILEPQSQAAELQGAGVERTRGPPPWSPPPTGARYVRPSARPRAGDLPRQQPSRLGPASVVTRFADAQDPLSAGPDSPIRPEQGTSGHLRVPVPNGPTISPKMTRG